MLLLLGMEWLLTFPYDEVRCAGIVRYRLSSQQNIHRCNSVWEEIKLCEGTTVFYFLQFPTIYGMIPPALYIQPSYQITHAPWRHIRKGESIPTVVVAWVTSIAWVAVLTYLRFDYKYGNCHRSSPAPQAPYPLQYM
jgi:hypothetical protein